MKLRKGQIGRSGEVGEWQCEVRWGARRMVARREQGAVGNVSRGEWGNSKRKSVITNSRIPGKKGKGGENGTRWLHGEHLFHPPAVRPADDDVAT